MEPTFADNAASCSLLQEELAPYLAGLNVSEALADFERLADLVLAGAPPPSSQLSHDDGAPFAHCLRATPSSGEQSELGSPSSPEGSSRYANSTPSSQWLSQPPSPTNLSCYNSSSFSSSSSSCSAPSSEASLSSFSSASSCYSAASVVTATVRNRRRRTNSSSKNKAKTLSLANKQSGGQRRRSGSTTSTNKSTSLTSVESPGGARKRQNATAAERYRRRLKSHTRTLDEELEVERERNARLLASFESKLMLYREFAHLLASNTRDPSHDAALATFGSRSLETVLECILPGLKLAGNAERTELEQILDHFRQLRPSIETANVTQGQYFY